MTTIDPRNRVAMENDGSRVDARAKVTGAAKYTTDIKLPDMIYATHLRSPFAEGKLESIDLAAARKIKGVLDVALYTTDYTSRTFTENAGEARPGRYSGESIGHVCAENPRILDDAVAALKMEWSHGEPRTNFRREIGRAGQFPAELSDGDQSTLDAVKKKAAYSSQGTYQTQVQHHVCTEPHGAVCDYQGDSAKIWISTQAVSRTQGPIANRLGLEQRSVELIADYVGGGFGSKFGAGIEGFLVADMSKKFNRPCKLTLSRKDENRDTGLRPGSLQYYEIYAGDDGKVLGGQYQARGEVGINGRSGGTRQLGYAMGQMVPSGGRGWGEQKNVALSSCDARPQRAPGAPQGAVGHESAMDELAEAVGMDPVEFRKLNDGIETRRRQFDIAANEIGWERRLPNGQWPGTVKRGFGIGAAQWGNSSFSIMSVEIRIYDDGKLEVRSGTQDIGTGTRTALVDLVAYQSGISREFIVGLCGQSNYPPGPGSGGSTVTRTIGPPTRRAGQKAAEAILALVADELDVPAEELKINGDQIVAIADGAAKMSWMDACKLIPGGQITVSANQGESNEFRGGGESYGVCAAEVEVDVETGVVRPIKLVSVQQCGMAVNRKTVESQIVGCVIGGISYALFEERILNSQTGAQVNPNMEAYKIAGPTDMPEIVPIIDTPDGYDAPRAIGEPALVGVAAAIMNAVANATGARVRSMPITPRKVLQALREAKEGGVA